MNCQTTQYHLESYLQNTSDRATTAAVTKHLASCADCQRELAFLRSYLQNMEHPDRIEAPADFTDRFHQRLEQSKPIRYRQKIFRFPFYSKQVYIGAAACTILLLGFTSWLLFGPSLISLMKPVPYHQAAFEPKIGEAEERHSLAPAPQLQSGITAPLSKKEEKKSNPMIAITLWMSKQVPASSLPLVKKSVPETGASFDQVMCESSDESEADHFRMREELSSIASEKSSSTDSPRTIDALIASVQGHILQRKLTDSLDLILTAKIPAVSYFNFITQLGSFGRVEIPNPRITIPQEGEVVIDLRVLEELR